MVHEPSIGSVLVKPIGLKEAEWIVALLSVVLLQHVTPRCPVIGKIVGPSVDDGVVSWRGFRIGHKYDGLAGGQLQAPGSGLFACGALNDGDHCVCPVAAINCSNLSRNAGS